MLYELRGTLYWNACIILEYNKSGFLTFTSQPGAARKNIIYKSAYHRLYGDKKEDNIFYGDMYYRLIAFWIHVVIIIKSMCINCSESIFFFHLFSTILVVNF
jgi:hypothetical protein